MAKYELVIDQTAMTMAPLTLAGPAGTEFLLDVRLSPNVERVLIRLALTPEGHIVMRWAPLEYRTADRCLAVTASEQPMPQCDNYPKCPCGGPEGWPDDTADRENADHAS